MTYISKGSMWGKWDLHVHTPESVLNNKFGIDWDNYVCMLILPNNNGHIVKHISLLQKPLG